MRRILKGLFTVSLLTGTLAVPSLAHADAKTERTWKAKCASCHGADGKGDTDQGKKQGVSDMSTADWQKKFTDDQIKGAILDGVKRDKDGKKQEMEPYKGKIADDVVAGLVAHVRSLKK